MYPGEKGDEGHLLLEEDHRHGAAVELDVDHVEVGGLLVEGDHCELASLLVPRTDVADARLVLVEGDHLNRQVAHAHRIAGSRHGHVEHFTQLLPLVQPLLQHFQKLALPVLQVLLAGEWI